jgi:hypothetical protein
MAIARDIHLPESHFRGFIAQNEGFIQEDLGIVQSDEWGPLDLYPIHNRIATTLYETMLASYSAGDEMNEVQRRFNAFLEYLPTLQAAREGIEDFVKGGYRSYNYTMSLLSLAVLFRLRDGDLTTVLGEVAFFPISDSLTETILARITGQEQGANANPLMFPNQFSDLLDAYEWNDMASQSALKRYMETWYSKNKDAYWHDRHKKKTVTGYFGYWSLETAAAAVLLALDDASFRDHPYYPKDWADWARRAS